MKNNILGGLVIFMVVLTCLLMIDDISNPQNHESTKNTAEIEKVDKRSDLAVVERED